MRKPILLFLFSIFFLVSFAQYEGYIYPKEPKVKPNLKELQDCKFGLFMHWGTYSQWGCVESWGLNPEVDDTVHRTGPYSADYFTYKKAYENLQTTFNPVNFNPEKWAKAAKYAGMKYVVFTTKHHDGFCMFDTKQTTYKITDPKTPFSPNIRSNVTKEIFNAFRKDSFKIGAYFSKPDWHNDNFWWPYFPPKDRNVNYDISKNHARWDRFKEFTYKQVEELVTGYGKLDILWFDGGWVIPAKQNPALDQDVDMPGIVSMARKHQPQLIVVDRWGPAEHENYRTPEQEIPEKPLTYPWETCMSMGNSWSYVPNDTYKTPLVLVQSLIKIVSRGGNFLLNIGPDSKGELDPVAYQRLHDMGDWMKLNSEGIYNTVPVAPYSKENIFYTKSKDKDLIYLYWLSESDDVKLPKEFTSLMSSNKTIKKVTLLANQQSVNWKVKDNNLTLLMPKSMNSKQPIKYAAVFKIEYKD